MTAEGLSRELGGVPRPGGGYKARCPAHADTRPSLDIDCKDGKLLYVCRAGCAQHDVTSKLYELGLLNGNGANGHQLAFVHKRRRETRRTAYEIRSVDGSLWAIHERIDFNDGTKEYPWKSADGRKGLGGRKVTESPLYRMETISEWPDGATVVLAEGEKATDAVQRAGLFALGTTTGAKKTGGDVHCDAALKPLLRFRIVAWADNDDVGRAHMNRHCARLLELGAREVFIINWPDAPPGGDAGDFEGDDSAMLALIEAAKPFQAPEIPTFGSLASDIPEEPIRWVVTNYFARKKLTEIIGEGGVGKTAALVDLIAGITRGRVFGHVDCQVGNVAILSAEDDPADTLVPRLKIAGANLNRVRIFPKYFEVDGDVHPLTFPEHLSLVEDTLRRDKTSLLIVDPISAFIGGKTETHNDSSTRKFLMTVDILAIRADCSIAYVRHVNKNSAETNAKNRGSGSVAFTNAPRLSYAIGFDPTNAEQPEVLRKRILAWSKGNICPAQPARAFRLLADENEPVHVEWLSETIPLMNANDLFREPRTPRKKEALEEAIQFLHDELDEGSKNASEITKHAEILGISGATLNRARLKAGVIKSKKGFTGGWVWSLNNNSEV